MNNKSHHNRTSFARDENTSPLSSELSEHTELSDDGRTRAAEAITTPLFSRGDAGISGGEIASPAKPGQLQLMRTYAPDERNQLDALRILSESAPSVPIPSEGQDEPHEQ